MKHILILPALLLATLLNVNARQSAVHSATQSAAPAESPAASAESPAAASIEGYWQIVEDKNPEAIALVYAQDGVHYIRMVALYDDAGEKIIETIADPKEKAKGLTGNPPLCGLDFVWGLKPESNGKRFKGNVTDPDSGSSYTCEVWFDEGKGKLVVRGELLVFGENQYWPSIKEEDVPSEARLDIEKIKLNVPQS